MAQDLIKEIISYPSRVASSDISCLFLHGDRLFQLGNDEATYLTGTFNEAINRITEDLIKNTDNQSSLNVDHACFLKAYTYCFDKSIEATYNLVTELDRAIEFNFADLYNGGGGNDIPPYMQMKVYSIIPRLALIFHQTLEHIAKNGYDKQATNNELIKAVLVGAMSLGVEFCLRINPRDSSELDSYLQR